jgi:hypothetical protein
MRQQPSKKHKKMKKENRVREKMMQAKKKKENKVWEKMMHAGITCN